MIVAYRGDEPRNTDIFVTRVSRGKDTSKPHALTMVMPLCALMPSTVNSPYISLCVRLYTRPTNPNGGIFVYCTNITVTYIGPTVTKHGTDVAKHANS